MSDDDLIRRGDAIEVARRFAYDPQMMRDTLAVLRAVLVDEEAFMTAVWGALKADATDLGKQQRILAAFRAALEPVAAPRRYMGQIMAECDCSRQVECEAAQRCLAAPDRAHHVNEPSKSEHDAGNVLTPDPAAIREAALREAADLLFTLAGEKGGTKTPQGRTAQYYARRILALIPKGAADDRA